jgi:hypothetical protein
MLRMEDPDHIHIGDLEVLQRVSAPRARRCTLQQRQLSESNRSACRDPGRVGPAVGKL